MEPPGRWESSWSQPDILTVRLESWRFFYDFIYEFVLQSNSYIWRGQRRDDWRLESTLERRLKSLPPDARQERTRQHLENFKYAVRGRRGANPPPLADENDWWALGQHHGMETPLLDWTRSPFVALYFAFLKTGAGQTPHRAVYALNQPAIERRSREIAKSHEGAGPSPMFTFVRPLVSDNPRLVNQGGLFTRTPDGVSPIDWVKAYMTEEARREEQELPPEAKVIAVLIPDSDREGCLIALNRMNINHLTLFPDVDGASAYCNRRLEIADY